MYDDYDDKMAGFMQATSHRSTPTSVLASILSIQSGKTGGHVPDTMLYWYRRGHQY